jgi:homoserine trans-succinylase
MKKITEQEMTELTQLREQYSKTIFEIGHLQYEKHELENQLKAIDDELTGLYGDITSNYQRQDDYLNKIREKYGDGNLDTQTGEILP